MKLDARGDIAVAVARQPAANSLSPAGRRGARGVWDAGRDGGASARDRHRLAQPGAVLRRRRHQGVHADGRGGGPRADRPRATRCCARWSSSGIVTIAAVNGMALGGGCELAMACDVRHRGAARPRSASPRSTSGSSPASAAPSGCRGSSARAKALEMNTTGEPISADEAYEFGLVNRVVADHELFDTALAWARKLARQAPLALEQIKRVSRPRRPRRGHRGREGGLRRGRSRSEDAREGIARLPRQAHAAVQGRLSAAARPRARWPA